MRSSLARALPALLPLALCCSTALARPIRSVALATPFTRLDATAARMLALTGGPAAGRRTDAGTTLLAVDDGAIRAFRAAGGGTLSIPAADGATVDLELEPYALFADGYGPTVTDNTGRHPFTPDVSLFRGHVAGDEQSMAVIAMSGAGVLGIIDQHGERLTLGPVQRMAAGAAAMGVHALAPEGSLAEQISHFECGINADNEVEYGLKTLPATGAERMLLSPEGTNLNAARFFFNLAVDCDQELYSNKFSANLTAETAYMMTVLGTVNLIDERDLETTLKLVYLNFWTTTDPYTATTTTNELPEFRSYWISSNNINTIPSQLQHLVSGRALGGGIAYLDAVCSNGYGVSAIDAIYSYPTVTSTWDVEVITHELGHNLGSPHTHSCTWAAEGRVPPNTTLDSCQASEGGCAVYTNHLPPDKGTIMSYCHLISSVAAGIRLDFHPICVSRMRGVMSNCAMFPNPAPPRNPAAANTPTGLQLSWTASTSTGVTGYSVYRSRLPLDLGALDIGQTAASPFNVPGLGTYYFRMRALRAADSSAFSGEIKATACSFTSGSPVSVGFLPTVATTEDLNGDGIQDVVLVTNSSLVTLLGLGTGGVGNGDFAAPVNVATASQPACFALLDANGDGILDAVVGSQNDNSLYLHLGQGSGGVGNGTFGPATLFATLDFPPTGIAVADFNEDGLLDLAVAGGSSSLALLLGQGTTGVPNGTFAAPVSVATATSTRGILAYDFNGDGITDLAVSGASVRILYGNGTGGKGDGTFTPGPIYSANTTPNHLATADFNGDGITDLVVCNTGASTVNVYLGNGTGGVPDGTFGAGISVPAGSGPNTAVIADWNQDGKADIAVASNNTGNSTSILLGLGNGTFETPQTFATGGNNPAAIAVNDFNEDGTPDLVACNRQSGSITRQLAGCPSVLSHALAITSPNGGETWVGGTEHTITWTKGVGVMTVDLLRSDDSGVHWRALARGLTGTSYSYTAAPPWTTHARFRVVEGHAAEFADGSNADFAVEDPALAVGDPPPALALLGAQPNPARQDLTVWYSLAVSGARGSLELLDLAGRRVAWRDLSGESAGRHQVTLLERSALSPGVYMIRLTHAGSVRGMKVAVIQ